jgi:hypothetical protein
MVGQAGQAAGQRRRVDLPVAGLPLVGVGGQLGLGGAQQADLGLDFGGQVLEGDCGVVAVELEGGAGGGQPLGGPLGALLTGRGGPQQPLQAGTAHRHQGMGVRPALEHGQVGLAELADQGAGRQQLMDQVLDAALVGGGLLGEPITSPHAAVQRRPGPIRQLQRPQPGRVDQREAGQGVGIDAVGLGMPRQEPAQIMRLGRADPIDDVAAGAEEDRDRQPRRPGRLDHDLQAGVRGRPPQGGLLDLAEALHGRERLASAHDRAVGAQHPHGMGAGDPKVDPDQPSVLHLVASLAAVACWAAASQGRRRVTATVPRALCPTTAPTHVLQPAPTQPGRATSLIRGIRGRPRAAIRRTRLGASAPSPEEDSTPPPEPAGMHMQPWDHGADQAPRSLT